MTTEPRATDGAGGPDGGETQPERVMDDSTLKSIEKDLDNLETHDLTVDDSAMGSRQNLRSVWRWAVFFGAVLLAVFHLWTAVTQTLPPLQQRSLHLALGLGLVFLLYPVKARPSGPPGRFYGAAMALGLMILGYMAAGVLTGGNVALYLYLPQVLFGVLALALLAGTWWWIFRWKPEGRGTPSPAQSSAGVTLLVLVGLISLDLGTSDIVGGGFFFLPIFGLVLILAALAVSVLVLRYPSAVPDKLWPAVSQWGMPAAGAGILLYMALSGIAGWYVVGPALLVLLLVQGSRPVSATVKGIPVFEIALALIGLGVGAYMAVNYGAVVESVGVSVPTYAMVGAIVALLLLAGAWFAVLLLGQGSRYRPPTVLGIPVFDVLLAGLGLGAGAYMFFNYRAIVESVGITNPAYVMVGTVGILLTLVAASRVLGKALVVLASAMIAFAYFGQSMPGFLQHRGAGVNQIVTNLWVSTEGVFGTPLGISATFIFLFMIFAALLQRTGMEKFFTDVALGATGSSIGGTAKVGIVTSAFTGTITGSSVAGTVSNGAFTIPMMKKSGYNKEYAGAVEAASSTGGQILPPIMGAGAFIMIEFTGASYQQILVAAAIPAIMFFVAQYVVVHYDSKRFGIGGLPRHMLPNVRQVLMTRGYLLIPIIAIFTLLSMGYSPMLSAMGAVASIVGINLFVQFLTMPWEKVEGRLRPRAAAEILWHAVRLSLPIIVAALGAAALVTLMQNAVTGVDRGVETLIACILVAVAACVVVAAFRKWAAHDPDRLDFNSFMDGLVGATRLALPIIIACASAGIIAGVITTTDLGLKLSAGLLGVADTLTDGIAFALNWLASTPLLPWVTPGADFGAAMVAELRLDLALVLIMSMLACLVLGIGLPTTANYVITATLASPAIVAVLQGEFETATLAMLLMAHMFVYYYGVLADITPPVCLAAYAAAGISGGDAIKTGVYSVRIANAAFIMPFMFVFNPALLLQDVTFLGGVVAVISGCAGAVLVALGMTGFIKREMPWLFRFGFVIAGLMVVATGFLTIVLGVALGAAMYSYELWKTRQLPDFVAQTEGMKPV